MRKDKVLLVDDDSTLVFIIADALRREGFEVVCAADGETGLEAVAASLPDVVVADVMMPPTERLRDGATYPCGTPIDAGIIPDRTHIYRRSS